MAYAVPAGAAFCGRPSSWPDEVGGQNSSRSTFSIPPRKNASITCLLHFTGMVESCLCVMVLIHMRGITESHLDHRYGDICVLIVGYSNGIYALVIMLAELVVLE